MAWACRRVSDAGKGNIHLQIYPHDGARITSLKAFGSEVLRQWQPQRRAFQYGCFPMVPWAGRLGNATLNAGGQCYSLPANKPPHALHGMACYSTWEIIDKTADSLTLRMPLTSPWPWQGEVIQTFCWRTMRWFCNWKSIHMPIHSRPPQAGIRGLRKKLTPQNTESLQVLLMRTGKKKRVVMNCQLEIVSLLKLVPGMTVLVL